MDYQVNGTFHKNKQLARESRTAYEPLISYFPRTSNFWKLTSSPGEARPCSNSRCPRQNILKPFTTPKNLPKIQPVSSSSSTVDGPHSLGETQWVYFTWIWPSWILLTFYLFHVGWEHIIVSELCVSGSDCLLHSNNTLLGSFVDLFFAQWANPFFVLYTNNLQIISILPVIPMTVLKWVIYSIWNFPDHTPDIGCFHLD